MYTSIRRRFLDASDDGHGIGIKRVLYSNSATVQFNRMLKIAFEGSYFEAAAQYYIHT